MQDLFDMFTEDDYSRIRNHQDDEYEDTVTDIDIDDTDTATIAELEPLDIVADGDING
jgi:hypothetical protein